MGSIGTVSGSNGAWISSGTLGRFIPEPKSNLRGVFGNVLKGVVSAASSVVGVSGAGIDSQYTSLLEQQMYMQEQMMKVSLVSNTLKAQHETEMAAVRNIRAG